MIRVKIHAYWEEKRPLHWWQVLTSDQLVYFGLFWNIKIWAYFFPFSVKNNIVVLFLFVDETGDCTPLTCGSTWCRGKKNINWFHISLEVPSSTVWTYYKPTGNHQWSCEIRMIQYYIYPVYLLNTGDKIGILVVRKWWLRSSVEMVHHRSTL